MNVNFNSISELYNRVYPALKSKVKELKRNKIDYVKEVDVWNCLVEYKWKKSIGLDLSEIVDDILNIDNFVLEQFVKNEIKKQKKEANYDIEIL